LPQNTCAIIVAFHPDEAFAARLRCIVEQFAQVFVIDNSEPPISDDGLLALQDAGVAVGGRTGNIGIGHALNIGLELAREAGFAWAMTLDQDTTLVPEALARLTSLGPFSGSPVLVGPNYYDLNKSAVARSFPPDTQAVRVTTLITSGMLCPVDFALWIGGFRGDFFIDSVDHEFCLRACRSGASAWMVCDVLMEQPIGPPDPRPAWVRRLARNHPPSRKYYMARNSLITLREYGAFYRRWAAWQVLRICSELLAAAAFDRQPGAVRALTRGIADGMAGRVGRRE
jgi:rhamnosyltransferase